MSDWTTDPRTGRSNSSQEFERMVMATTQIIQNDAAILVRGGAEEVARHILANLVHRYNLVPGPPKPRPNYRLGNSAWRVP
jgi:hypothetical protein